MAPRGGDQRYPHRLAAEPGWGQLRWARCPHDGHLHLLAPAEAVIAATGGHAQALCGQALAADGLTLAPGSPGAPCMTCVDGIRFPSKDPDPRGIS